MRLRRILLGLLFATTVGCYGYAYVPVGGEVVVTSAPYAAIERGAYVYYEGRPHYWYHRHWYYRDGNRWYYYPREPSYLHEYRRYHRY